MYRNKTFKILFKKYFLEVFDRMCDVPMFQRYL